MERPNKHCQLKEWFTNHGVSAVLFDLDDTLIFTSEIFVRQMGNYIRFVIDRLPQLDYEATLSQFKEINNQLFQTHAVNPKRWGYVVDNLSQSFELSPTNRNVFFEGFPIIEKIYKTTPLLKPGAIATVHTIQSLNLDTKLVTHANEPWTWFKLRTTNLDNFFPRGRVYIVHEDKHKGPTDWEQAIQSIGIRPEQVLVVGDNLAGDIRASAEIGVRHRIYTPSEWVLYNSGEIPEGTIVVKSIIQVIPALLGQL